ncbi:hypothetical protein [Streptomyces sp. AV19]|uniref:hypothetical protein n=1 Tax=Streptomyces sp. AV19 TaxID=2793068 RepID=UPI002412EA78|nr:hypothetical protein [Streptomyces sp. AV19]MDG4532475.1 hypothetical protein [Streptomyces sp. AV19]
MRAARWARTVRAQRAGLRDDEHAGFDDNHAGCAAGRATFPGAGRRRDDDHAGRHRPSGPAPQTA